MLNTIRIGYSNTHHDSSIAVEYQGKIFAEPIDRTTQNKKNYISLGFHVIPRMIRNAIRILDIDINEVDNVEIITTWKFGLLGRVKLYSVYALLKYLLFATHFVSKNSDRYEHYRKFLAHIMVSTFAQPAYVQFQRLFALRVADKVFRHRLKSVRLHQKPHHLTHASLGVFSSPFEECVVLVLDGSGENSTGTLYLYRHGKFKKIKTVYALVGVLYGLVTILCGFEPSEGEEWKVMGLAPYGKFNRELYDFFSGLFVVKGISMKSALFTPSKYKKLLKIAGEFRSESNSDVMKSADLAYNFQKVVEEKVLEFIDNISKKKYSENLIFTGGVALNSSLNGLIHTNTGFANVHIPSAPGDDGNCVGAVINESFLKKRDNDNKEYLTPYLGSKINMASLEKIVNYKQVKYKQHKPDKLPRVVAEEIAKGKIVGWMQGRSEFGPRALGNRSILADPRQKEMKEKINSRVKFRELYRPFAPSILEEYAEDYFENYYPSLYMERTLKFKKSVRSKVPAVVHVNNTGRLQTVRKDWNPRYYELIDEFRKITGVPLLLNTSLNVMGKPIVGSVEDAFTLFYTTGIDLMVIDNYVFSK